MAYNKYAHIKCDTCANAPCTCKPISWTWSGIPMQFQRVWHARYQEVKASEAREEADGKQWEYELAAAALRAAGARQTSGKFKSIALPGSRRSIELDGRTWRAFQRVRHMPDPIDVPVDE